MERSSSGLPTTKAPPYKNRTISKPVIVRGETHWHDTPPIIPLLIDTGHSFFTISQANAPDVSQKRKQKVKGRLLRT